MPDQVRQLEAEAAAGHPHETETVGVTRASYQVDRCPLPGRTVVSVRAVAVSLRIECRGEDNVTGLKCDSMYRTALYFDEYFQPISVSLQQPIIPHY